jgi:hypothetical protein
VISGGSVSLQLRGLLVRRSVVVSLKSTCRIRRYLATENVWIKSMDPLTDFEMQRHSYMLHRWLREVRTGKRSKRQSCSTSIAA